MITAHADVVGSLLRPAELLAAQKQLAAGTVTAAQFKEIEDRTVDEGHRVAGERRVGSPDRRGPMSTARGWTWN